MRTDVSALLPEGTAKGEIMSRWSFQRCTQETTQKDIAQQNEMDPNTDNKRHS